MGSLFHRPRRPAARARARAAILPMVACLMCLLTAMAALAVDASAAYRARARNVQSATLASEATMLSLNTIKYSADPAAAAWTLAHTQLVRDGFTGTATFYYWEAPESATGPQQRVAGMYLELETEQGTVFSSLLGSSGLVVSNEAAWTTNPYSDTVVYRPTGVVNRRYTCEYVDGVKESRTTKTSLSSTSYSECPAALRAAIDRALAAL